MKHFILHRLIRTHKWPAPTVSGFIAQLVRASHRYRVQTPLNSWLFHASTRNCLNCVHNCDDHSLFVISVCWASIFLQVNMVKTKVANRLHASTVAKSLLVRQHLVRQDKQCYDYTPSKELIDTACFWQCHSQYTAWLNNASEQNSTISTIILSAYDIVDVVDSV